MCARCGWSANHAINVVIVARGYECLYFAVVHGAVFQIEPDTVEVVVGGVSDIEWQEVSG